MSWYPERLRSSRRKRPTQFSSSQIGQLEIDVRSGALDETAVVSVLSTMARKGQHAPVQALISRLHCGGLRTERFLSFAVDHALALRDLTAAHRYAVSLRHDLRGGGEALFRLAHVEYLTGAYGIAASLYREFVDQSPNSAKAQRHLGDCYLRQGSLSAALDCYRKGGGLAQDEEKWLSGIAENGHSRRRADWYGSKTAPMPRLKVHAWRARVLNAPLRFRARDLTEIDLWINSCRYVSDERLFGEADYWQTPDQTEANLMGDCEDFAIWAWVQLLRQSVPSRLVLGGLFSDEPNHAWVQIYNRGSVGVLECTPIGFNLVIGSRHATEYLPIFSIDKGLRWYDHT